MGESELGHDVVGGRLAVKAMKPHGETHPVPCCIGTGPPSRIGGGF
jgi:hypothetical protein